MLKNLQLTDDYQLDKLVLKNQDGQELITHLSALKIRQQGSTSDRIICTIRDMTDIRSYQEEMKRSLELLEVLNKMLLLANSGANSTQLLEEILDIILSAPGCNFQKKGCIFLVEKDPKVLKLRTYRHLDASLHEKCGMVPFGECLCGKAAQTKTKVYSKCVESDHTISFSGMKSHGHYCLPLMNANEILGVLNVYLPSGHEHNATEEQFLESVASTLATILVRARIEVEKEEMQGQLIQSAKMASVGTLAAGVAHELNNPLTVVLGMSSMLMKDQKVPEKVLLLAEDMNKNAHRMRSIIDHLRTFSRKSHKTVLSPICLLETIHDATSFLKSQLAVNQVSFQLEAPFPHCYILGDKTQIESVFQNLLVNSRDAFALVKDDRGKQISLTVAERDGNWTLRYQDNASGMSKKVLANIFDPFYTTKEAGKGTGLGMSITHNIIKDHGGSITVTSSPGEGSCFEFYFPVSNEVPPSTDSRDDRANARNDAKQGTYKPSLLLVEDDLEVAKYIEALLSAHFIVTKYIDPRKALHKLSEDTYDMVLTDLKMPWASGFDIFYKAKECQPETPVVVMSGFTDQQSQVDRILNEGAAGYLPKPFIDEQEVISMLNNLLKQK